MSDENPRFPHSGIFSYPSGTYSADQVTAWLASTLTPERRERIRIAVENRTCNLVAVLENIYDRGNISAVLRSAEAMGVQCAHVIESGEKFKEANRVTQGADKWLDVKRWKTTKDCVRELKKQGFQILVTHLDANAKPIDECDFSIPTAIVLGNEKDGVSKEMVESADQTIIIPMQGFVQSFNISVAGALALYHARLARMSKIGHHGDLSERQKRILRAEFSLRSADNPEQLLKNLAARDV
jgi:tRNA (guanosine-2'-O-)-methyltransferase